MSKEHLLHILRDGKPDKAGRLKNALDDYKGSFAVKFYLEATLELLNPPTQSPSIQAPCRPRCPGAVQCVGCDGGVCTTEHGELRKLPSGDSNLILCRSCFEHEMRFRHDEVMRGIQFELPAWESLEVYGQS